MGALNLPRSLSPRASIVVIARKNARLLEGCLRALSRSLPRDEHCEVILVVNDPEPEVRRLVDDRVTGANVVESPVNLGFGGANNLGARSASGEFIVLLNDDTEI